MSKIAITLLLLVLIFIPWCAWSDEGIEFIFEDTLARFLQALSRQGASGETATVTIPRETYQMKIEEPEEGLPSEYVIHRAPVLARVEGWKIDSATFTAERITLLRPNIQLYQGTAESIEEYLRQARPLDTEPRQEERPTGDGFPGGASAEEHRTPESALNTLEFVQNRQTTFRVKKLEIRDGIFRTVNTLSNPSHSLLLDGIRLDLSGLVVPDKHREGPVECELAFNIQSASPGSFSATLRDESEGDVSDFTLSGKVNQLDISVLAPFLPIEEEWRIRSGLLGIVVNATCVKDQFSSGNLLILKDLSIEAGDKDSWLGDLALKALSKVGSSVYEDVQLEFEISGDLSDPEFDLGEAYGEAFQDALVRWTTTQALCSLGLKEK